MLGCGDILYTNKKPGVRGHVAGEEAGPALLAHQCVREDGGHDEEEERGGRRAQERDKHPEYFILHPRGYYPFTIFYLFVVQYINIYCQIITFDQISLQPSHLLELKQGDKSRVGSFCLCGTRVIECDAHSVQASSR
jgi:hypothetical protein